jgi:peptidoglycan/xylan/chitin deacetylase (PgdA/CDA1 family)
MALATDSVAAIARASSPCTRLRESGRNDAFSFWKLPEDHRQALAAATAYSEAIAEHYLFERYLSNDHRRPPSTLKAYYRVKNLIPGRLRHRINSLAIRVRPQLDFPHWPCESALMEFWREWLHRSLESLGRRDGWHIGFWPNNHSCCIVLTHDVESPLGLERMERMAELEEEYGFRSMWNLPLAQYPIDWTRVARLQARGFEFGAHGLSHDGKLFRSSRDFAELAPMLERLARDHDLKGFRAPSTLRRAEWIATMAFDFDSSFADTDPYEPQAGGTCSLFPFHLGALIELPYTLPQDHTMLHLLRRSPLQLWAVKAQWIASLGGMVLVLTHPDYFGTQPRLGQYEELLKRLRDIENGWYVLPSAAAAWWRRRSELKLIVENDRPSLAGPDTTGAVAVRLGAEPLAL